MGQDNITCAKCDRLCGYDAKKAVWWGIDRKGDKHAAICGQCKSNIVSRFCAFFGVESVSPEESGLCLEWDDVDNILSKIKRDYTMKVSYIITDKELYERTKTLPVSILMP